MIFIDVEQNTPEWLQLRCGKLTASSFACVMANYGKAFGEPAKKLAMTIAVEQITGKPTPSEYSNKHMERGHIQEPLAREEYEKKYFVNIENGGFFDCGNVGVSPDGLIGNGRIEIKSVIPSVHLSTIAKQSYPSAYKWQLIGNMLYTEADYIDFVSYCDQFPDDKKLYVCTLPRDNFKLEYEMLESRFRQFFELVEENKQLIRNSNYEVKL